MALDAFLFSFPLRVRWSEVDAQGIVFNPHYLTYFDVAVTDYWRAIGFPYPKAFLAEGVDTFTVKSTVEYHAPAHFDDTLAVLVRAARLGRTSLRVAFEVYREASKSEGSLEGKPPSPPNPEAHLVSGEIIYVFATPEERKPVPIPQALRVALLAYEKTTPEEA